MPHKSLPQESWLLQPAKRLQKSMRLLLEEVSLRPRACAQLKKDALTEVLPVNARTCHLPYLFWSWVCSSHEEFCRCHEPSTTRLGGPAWHVPARSQRSAALACCCSQGSMPWMHSQCFQTWLCYSSVVSGPKGSEKINQHTECLAKEEKLSCRHSRAFYFSWCSKVIHISPFNLTQTLKQFCLIKPYLIICLLLGLFS